MLPANLAGRQHPRLARRSLQCAFPALLDVPYCFESVSPTHDTILPAALGRRRYVLIERKVEGTPSLALRNKALHTTDGGDIAEQSEAKARSA